MDEMKKEEEAAKRKKHEVEQADGQAGTDFSQTQSECLTCALLVEMLRHILTSQDLWQVIPQDAGITSSMEYVPGRMFFWQIRKMLGSLKQ